MDAGSVKAKIQEGLLRSLGGATLMVPSTWIVECPHRSNSCPKGYGALLSRVPTRMASSACCGWSPLASDLMRAGHSGAAHLYTLQDGNHKQVRL